MRIFGIVLCLIALGLTGYSALTYKAPEIEADIANRSAKALATASTDDEIAIQVDGRHVTISGRVADDEQKTTLLSLAAAVPGALGPIDDLETLTIVSPYQFGASKDEEGKVVVQGYAPTSEVKASIETEARALFGDDASIDIAVAVGAPDGDWRSAAGSALDALATMRQGELTIVDSDVVLEGDVAVDADLEAIDIFAQSVPDDFTWSHDVVVHQGMVDPFTFSAEKDAETGLRLSGFAPDEETRTALIETGKEVADGMPVIADIQIAGGMPDQEWPALAHSGLSALKDVASGQVNIVGNDVSFSEDPAASEEPAAVSGDAASTESTTAAAATDEALDAALAPNADNQSSPTDAAAADPVFTIDKAEEGVWSIRGAVPDQEAEDRLVSMVRDHAGVVDVDVALDQTGGDVDDDWLRFAQERIRSLDEVRAGRLSLEAFDAHLIGVVETQDDIEPVETALAAIDDSMTVDLQPVDPRLTASLDLKMSSKDGVVLSGTLPGALTEGEALLALGIRRYDGKLEENGRGPAETWRQHLSEIGDLLPAFEEIDLSLGGERPTIKGRIHAHSDADVIARELVLALGDARQPLVDVKTATTVHVDGASRINPLTGEREISREGHWLPVVDFAADEQTCREHASAMLAKEKITFLRGQEDLDHRAETILNALAAVATLCLDKTELVLEIGGHTDSRGAAQMNQELSQARADAVRTALVNRGVDATSLSTVGFGPSRPIADNTTDEGRAANRRITFEWKAASDGQAVEAEG